MNLFFISFLFLTSFISSSQNILRGKIIDKIDKKELKYVNIALKNKYKGTYSDENGNFNIDFQKSKDTLLFRCIGYKKMEVFNIKYDTIIIKMDKDTISLEEIKIKPIIKNCKKLKLKYKEAKFNQVLFEGTIIRRKLKLENKYLCGFILVLIPNYDAKIIMRPYLTNQNNDNLFSNDYLVEKNLIKNKLNKIRFDFKENISLTNGFYYLGLEIISLPNNNNYSNNIQILCSDDTESSTEVLSIFNFSQQEHRNMNFDKKSDCNIKLELIISN